MRVIVGGAGQVGMHLIDFLVAEGNDVVVLDSSPSKIREINDRYEVLAIVGHVSDPEALEQAGASEDTDIFISVAQSDEVNMVAAQIARNVFGIQNNIARIRRRSYQGEYYAKLFEEELFAVSNVIWPEMETAEAIRASLSIPGAVEAISLCNDIVKLISLQLEGNCPILGQSLRDLTAQFITLPITVVGIVRKDKMVVPSAREVLLADDQIYFCTDAQYVDQALETFGHRPKSLDNVIIAGGGQIGTELALKLVKDNNDVRIRIIESNPARAREVSQILQGRAVVLRGDAMDMGLLEDAGLERADCMLSLTNNEETNILLALLAKRQGRREDVQGECRVGALVNHADYFPLLKALGVDMVISPREITASNILRYLRLGHVHQAHAVAGGLAEVLESEISQNSPVYKKTIQQAHFPKDTIVGAIMRDDRMLVPKPEMIIQEGDHLVVVATRAKVKQLQDKLSPFTYN